MTKSILIADTAYEPAFSFAKQLYKEKKNLLFISSSSSRLQFDNAIKSTVINWDRKSPISSVAAIRYAESEGNGVNKAVIFFNPVKPTLQKELTISEIEKLIDAKIKGLTFILRELSDLFTKREGGIIIPVIYNNGGKISKYDKMALSAFKTLVNEMIKEKNRPYQVIGVNTGDFDQEKTVEYLIKVMEMEKKKSKWLRPDNISNFKSFRQRNRL